MKKMFYLLGLLFLVLLTGCGKDTDNFKIELESNASTGYEWVYKMDVDSTVKEESSEYIAPKEEIAGAVGKQVFSFSGVKEGEVILTFSYEKSFEENSSIDTKIYVLTVDKDLKITENKEKAQELLQPDVIDDAITVANFNYNHTNWNYNVSGTYTNTTSYNFSKVIFTYDALGVGYEDDCGDIVFTINDVKKNETKDFSFTNISLTKVSCQYEYDKLSLQSIKAYK